MLRNAAKFRRFNRIELQLGRKPKKLRTFARLQALVTTATSDPRPTIEEIGTCFIYGSTISTLRTTGSCAQSLPVRCFAMSKPNCGVPMCLTYFQHTLIADFIEGIVGDRHYSHAFFSAMAPGTHITKYAASVFVSTEMLYTPPPTFLFQKNTAAVLGCCV